jgi:hypothetical protein
MPRARSFPLQGDSLALVLSYLTPLELCRTLPLVSRECRDLCGESAAAWPTSLCLAKAAFARFLNASETEATKPAAVGADLGSQAVDADDLEHQTSALYRRFQRVWARVSKVEFRGVSLRGVAKLGALCPLVRTVQCDIGQREALSVMAAAWPRLQHLVLRMATHVSGGGIALFTELRRLHIHLSQMEDHEWLTTVANACPKLTHFALTSSSSAGGLRAGLHSLATHRRLTSFVVSSCERLCDEDVLALVASCPDLRHLGIEECRLISDASMAAVGQHARALRSLRIVGLDITDAGVWAVAVGCPHLLHFSALLCMNLTDDCLEALLLGCGQLRRLETSVAVPSDTGLATIAALAPALQELAISQAPVTNAGLAALARGCLRLRSLKLAFCDRLTDRGVLDLEKGLPALTRLTVYRTRRTFISRSAVRELAAARLRRYGTPLATTVSERQ